MELFIIKAVRTIKPMKINIRPPPPPWRWQLFFLPLLLSQFSPIIFLSLLQLGPQVWLKLFTILSCSSGSLVITSVIPLLHIWVSLVKFLLFAQIHCLDVFFWIVVTLEGGLVFFIFLLHFGYVFPHFLIKYQFFAIHFGWVSFYRFHHNVVIFINFIFWNFIFILLGFGIHKFFHISCISHTL